MLGRASLTSMLIPLAAMWVAIILVMTLLVDTPSVRIWMVIIGAAATAGVMLKAWLDTRKA